ncbi:mapeg family protein [Ophiostoma piceae UAMH 11346]|uniref:Mapeg family protein n=1 Tax=Ophiostoma piceae (strain UAMH 11346) TaxID=1262450 RepID=S3D7S0_OPHP1|nr:mapeg family protein [Ophiostoma piceae UAMH 11346]
MSLTLQVPAEYGYVFGAATAIFFVNTYHSILTGKYRRKANIPYPTCYASTELADKDPAAFQFNCAQRAHSNFIENLTPLLGEMFVSGLHFPLLSAGLGLAWAVSRVLYAQGYTSKGPNGRYVGAVHSLFDLVLKITSGYTAYTFIRGGL